VSTTYQVQNWDQLFENNKSRTVDQCHFVCVPNKQDGMGLTRVLSHPNGAAIYGIWHLILGACSRQRRPRDGWMTDDGHRTGTAWALSDLALRWRRQESEIAEAIEVLTSRNIGWIKGFQRGETEVSDQCPNGVSSVSDGGHRRKEGKKEEKEGARTLGFKDGHEEPLIPTIEEVLAFTRQGAGIPDDYARSYVDKCCVKKRWLTKTHRGVDVIDWRKEIVSWWVNDKATWGSKRSGGSGGGRPRNEPNI
jgi:hypothetical protein